MINIKDLHIEKELLPLLNFTKNDFSKNILLDILNQPLNSLEEIFFRQTLLQGFIANYDVLKNFSYSRVDLLEVFAFLKQSNFSANPKRISKIQLLISDQKRYRKAGELIQVVQLFHKFQIFYFSRLNLDKFPKEYKNILHNLNDFLSSLNLTKYEILIREQKFKVKHIIELNQLLTKKIDNGQVEVFWKNYFLFEAYLSLSFGIVKHKWTFPKFSEKEFTLLDFYHPLLLNPTVNSFTTSNHVILLTGPNMSGKSTFLKAVSLCVYLGNIGIAVPASRAEIPHSEIISVSINLNDDILSGFSHFMTEVMNLKKVVLEAANNKKCFAVFDELFRGTNNEDAVEISTATIKGLTKFTNSIFFISTHLQELKEIDEIKNNNIATYYIDCELKENNPRFTYKLKEGWSDLKVGRLLFEKEGLNNLLM